MARKDAGSTPHNSNQHVNREAWLQAAVEKLALYFTEAGHPLPTRIRCSVGFTGAGKSAKKSAEVWRAEKSGDRTTEIFHAPTVDDPFDVLTALTGCLVTCLTPTKPDGNVTYKSIAADVGLRGTRREPACGPALRDRLLALREELGPFPHARLDVTSEKVGKQGTRMLAAACPVCKARIRLAASTVEKSGLPICSADMVHFELDKGKDAATTGLPTDPILPTTPMSEVEKPEAEVDKLSVSDLPPAVGETPSSPVESPASSWTARFPNGLRPAVSNKLLKLGGKRSSEEGCWSGSGRHLETGDLVRSVGGEFTVVDEAAAGSGPAPGGLPDEQSALAS